MKRLLQTVIAFLLAGLVFSCSEPYKIQSEHYSLNSDWKMNSTYLSPEDGETVSLTSYEPQNWYPANVPTTVLNVLINEKVYPHPYIGLNNFKIPDACDEYNEKFNLSKYSHFGEEKNPWEDPYWFRKEFQLPDDFKGKNIRLHFDGINYRADVWLNGHQIANQEEMVGMFIRFTYDITPFLVRDQPNVLAVKIHPVDHPGLTQPGIQFKVFGEPRGNAPDIFKDETMKMSGGWDCAPIIRDRNMGIYQDVYLTASDAVRITNPFIITDLPLPDTTRADVNLSFELSNTSDHEVEGEVEATISLMNPVVFPTYTKEMKGEMEDVIVRQSFSLQPGEKKIIAMTSAEFPELQLENPYLWWPNGYGEQYLHTLDLVVEVDGEISDKSHTSFGIREVSNEVVKIQNEYGRVFYINGRKVFCRGGWLQPEALLDFSEKRMYNEARLLALANVNMIANEDTPSPPEMVLETYDKYGLMYWETFYQCMRTYPGSPNANNPLDHDLAIREAQDMIKRYRNHPSVVLWCAANETTVAEDIYVAWRKAVIELDGTRPFIPASNINWDVDKLTPYIKQDLPLGTTDEYEPGYKWYPESFYFDKILEVQHQTFRNEMGVVSMPVYRSLEKFIPEFSNDHASPIYPLDSTWAEHGAWDKIDYTGVMEDYAFGKYDSVIRAFYGQPKSVADYSRKAQFINANSYRAMFEAANHRMWDITSGVMLWKLNSCWPSVMWQMFDWYQTQTASYYYARKAMEPVHVQMNANTNIVSVINTRYEDYDSLNLTASLIDLNLKEVWKNHETIRVKQNQYTEFSKIPTELSPGPVSFVKLELRNSSDRLISRNVYWIAENTSNFAYLSDLEPVVPEISCVAKGIDGEWHVSLKLKNDTEKISFFNRYMIAKGMHGDEVLPSFWDDNFIILFPGDEASVNVSFADEDLDGANPFLCIDGVADFEPIALRKEE